MKTHYDLVLGQLNYSRAILSTCLLWKDSDTLGTDNWNATCVGNVTIPDARYMDIIIFIDSCLHYRAFNCYEVYNKRWYLV